MSATTISRHEFWETIREYEAKYAYGSETALLGHVIDDCGGPDNEEPLDQEQAAWWIDAYRNYGIYEEGVQAINERGPDNPWSEDQRKLDALVSDVSDAVFNGGFFNGHSTPAIMQDKDDLGDLYDKHAPLPFSRDDFIFWFSA